MPEVNLGGRAKMKRLGVIVLKVVVSVVLFVLAAAFGNVLDQAVSQSRVPVGAHVLFWPSVVSVWCWGIPIPTRWAAYGAGVGVGFVLWAVGLVLRAGLWNATESPEIAAFVPALFIAGAGPVGAFVAYLVIRARRNRT